MVTRTAKQDGDDVQDVTPRGPDTLLLEAVQLDGANDTAGQQSQAQEAQAAEVVADTAKELLGVLQLARDMSLPILPARKGEKLRVVWRDERLQVAATAGAAVMQKHAWVLGDVLSEYMPYVALFVALVGPVMETRAVLSEPEPKPAQEAKGDE